MAWSRRPLTSSTWPLARLRSWAHALYAPQHPTPAKGTPFVRLAGHRSGRDVASEGSLLLRLHDRLVPDLHSLAFYYQMAARFITDAGMENPAAKMTLGQMSEALFMLALPIFLKLYGIKTTLLRA